MANYYRTNEGDLLDWICWNYYVREVSLGSAAMAIDPRLLSDDVDLDSGFLLSQSLNNGLSGAVELVLASNEGLAEYPLSLPAGLRIFLPDIDQQLVENDTVKLWE